MGIASAIPRAGLKDLFLLFVGRRRRFVVSGHSMLPTLADGDLVFCDTSGASRTRIGDVVVADHPLHRGSMIIKRVSAIDGDRWQLLGDNPSESTDSRTLGAISVAKIIGRVSARA
jgi:nickel-type superoxide dismutase maturation protease